ncbi:MAG: hypothetical protein GX254_02440 [Clostridiales bacterium]|nr:hypothetical protein [Clostridiales bacterium]
MNQSIINQAYELYLLEMELIKQQENLEFLYQKGHGIGSSLFTMEYEKLSALTARYMQIETLYNELIKDKPQNRRHAKKARSGKIAC